MKRLCYVLWRAGSVEGRGWMCSHRNHLRTGTVSCDEGVWSVQRGRLGCGHTTPQNGCGCCGVVVSHQQWLDGGRGRAWLKVMVRWWEGQGMAEGVHYHG